MDFLEEARKIEDLLVSIRRDLHQNPELDFDLTRTHGKVVEFLNKHNIPNVTVAKVGVCATIQGKGGGRCIGIRADMDALPLMDRKDCPYKSKVDGKMHACGHDAHTAMGLGIAKILNENKASFSGTVKIFFEPAEETTGGAPGMITEGVLENPSVDSIIGLHVSEDIDCGKIGIKYNTINAASNPFRIKIKGRGGHGAHPEKSVDPIIVSTNIINSLQTLISRETAPTTPAVITVGYIHSGTSQNIIPEEAEFGGIIRTLTTEDRDFIKLRFRDIVMGIAKSMRAKAEIFIEESYPCLVNNDTMVDIVKESARQIIGDENVKSLKVPSMGVESFAYFSNARPSAFYYLGTRNEQKGIIHPAHGSLFDIDEDAMKLGVAIQCKAAISFLEQINK